MHDGHVDLYITAIDLAANMMPCQQLSWLDLVVYLETSAEDCAHNFLGKSVVCTASTV